MKRKTIREIHNDVRVKVLCVADIYYQKITIFGSNLGNSFIFGNMKDTPNHKKWQDQSVVSKQPDYIFSLNYAYIFH